MKNYKVLPKGYSNLEDFDLLEKHLIFLMDSVLNDFKDSKRYFELTFRLKDFESKDELEFISESTRKTKALTDREKKIMGSNKKKEILENIKECLREEFGL